MERAHQSTIAVVKTLLCHNIVVPVYYVQNVINGHFTINHKNAAIQTQILAKLFIVMAVNIAQEINYVQIVR